MIFAWPEACKSYQSLLYLINQNLITRKLVKIRGGKHIYLHVQGGFFWGGGLGLILGFFLVFLHTLFFCLGGDFISSKISSGNVSLMMEGGENSTLASFCKDLL